MGDLEPWQYCAQGVFHNYKKGKDLLAREWAHSIKKSCGIEDTEDGWYRTLCEGRVWEEGLGNCTWKSSV